MSPQDKINKDMRALLEEADYLYGTRLQKDDDETVKFWNRLGLKAKSTGNFSKAKQFYMAALKIRPQNKVINFNMALLLVEQQEYDGALAYISKALRLHPNFKAGHELKDAIEQLMGR
jgi:tetratricopeptide (TPR) repeat protein